MAQLNPYLKFNGNCREAMAFYQQCFGGELTMTVVGESPMAEYMPKEAQSNILHSELSIDKLRLFASDMMDGEPRPGNNTALCFNGTTQDVTEAFTKFSEGGKVDHPLEKTYFGMFGDLTDKFGISWMFQSDPDPES